MFLDFNINKKNSRSGSTILRKGSRDLNRRGAEIKKKKKPKMRHDEDSNSSFESDSDFDTLAEEVADNDIN